MTTTVARNKMKIFPSEDDVGSSVFTQQAWSKVSKVMFRCRKEEGSRVREEVSSLLEPSLLRLKVLTLSETQLSYSKQNKN